jgi:cyanophycin synthetase
VRDFIEERCRRGGRAVVLEPTDKGDMIVIRHGRRSMQLAWTHLLPSTFGGAATMNVANAMAAAGAAFAAGAPLHDIRQGLRTFTTSYYLSPGRMNLLDINNIDVLVDYCHNPPGMRMLGDFVESYSAQKAGQSELGKPSRIGMIGAAGDRRDDDIRELGAIAADHFDVVVVREDDRLRGRAPGVTAELVAQGARARMAQGLGALSPGRDRAGGGGCRTSLHGSCQPWRPRRPVRRQARDRHRRARGLHQSRPGGFTQR